MAGKRLLVSFDHDNRAMWFRRKNGRDSGQEAIDAGKARELTDAELASLNKGARDMAFPDKPEKPAAKKPAKKANGK